MARKSEGRTVSGTAPEPSAPVTMTPTSPARSAALAATVLSTVALAITYAFSFRRGGAPGWAPGVFVVALACLLVGVMSLGVARRGRGLGRLAVPFALIWLLLVGGFGLVLALPDADAARGVLWLGLPPRAAVVVYGIGLFPVLLLPLAYAFTFDELTLSEADLERVRAARRRPHASDGAVADPPAAAGRR
jgi:hypothetical protein